MAIGVIGRKCGMTRVFTEEGVSVPVTVIEVSPNRVSQVKTEESDGYQAVQVTVGERRASRVTKAQAGHFAKAGVEAGRGVWEFRAEAGEFEAGSAVTVEGFEAGQMIDVTGSSKGKGFAGGVKRWNFSTQDATHGNSLSHRAPGSIGQNQTPGRVFKGVWEFRAEAGEFEAGSAVTVEGFEAGQMIDVTGSSKGKGFAGGVKRWNFSTQDATHGNSLSHRAPGSIGQNQTPGRVFKGKKMAGHLGAERVTVQNLEVVRVDADKNLLLVKGAVPGATGGDVIVRLAVKAKA